jgi:periplasmic nitrate reductase NapD
VVEPQRTESTCTLLRALPGIEVHHVEATAGRIVITQEAESIRAEVEGLTRIRALPGIILAEMSYHYFEEDGELLDNIPPGLDNASAGPFDIPGYLNE